MRQRSILEFAGDKIPCRKPTSAYIDLTNDEEIVVEVERDKEAEIPLKNEVSETGKHIGEFATDEVSCSANKGEIGAVYREKKEPLPITNEQAGSAEEKIVEADPVSCPVCDLSITSLTIESRTRHVEACLTIESTTKRQFTQVAAKEVKSLKRKEKKEVPVVLKEKAKYVNKKQKVKDESGTKVIKHPTKFPKPRERPPIPGVKIMDFPVSNGRSYKISMDAFSFCPNEEISQYFLSHFHSDHYGGINKRWCYERVFNLTDGKEEIIDDNSDFKKIIYCSAITSKLLTIKFGIDPRFIKSLEYDRRYLVNRYDDVELLDGGEQSDATVPGLYVIPMTANHCPGSCIFLFESISNDQKRHQILHCGDFRACPQMLAHPALQPFCISDGHSKDTLDKIYLDTTYMSAKYNFPDQGLVCEVVADMFHDLTNDTGEQSMFEHWFGVLKQSRITDYFSNRGSGKSKKKFLILVGTYVIGKERLAIAISRRLGCPIFASNIHSRDDKHQILKSYDDEYLSSVLTTSDLGTDASDCVVHLVPMRIVSNVIEMNNYYNHNKYFDHFERCVGLRPTGWTFSESENRPPMPVDNIDEEALLTTLEYETVENTSLQSSVDQMIELFKVMKSKPRYSFVEDILSQGNPVKAKVKKPTNRDNHTVKAYAVPYSEHSSYRELSYFSVFLNSKEIIPTVNIHNEWSIMRMQEIIKNWNRLRNALLKKDVPGVPSNIYNEINQLSVNDF